VGLPQTITLEGEWEVALTEIHYPHSWNNVQRNFLNRFLLHNRDLHGVWKAIIIPPGHYLKDDVKFSYDPLSRKVSVGLQNGAEIVLEILHTYSASNLPPKLFQIQAQVREKRTWSMAFMTFTFIVTSRKHNMLEMRLYHCSALFR